MPHAPGTDLGGARSLQDVQGRCWVDPATGCWHLRTKYGRPWPTGKQLKIWWRPAQQCVLARRIAWELHHGRTLRPAACVADRCGTWDCINPGHLRELTREQAVRLHHARGAFKTGAVLAARRAAGAARSKLSPELWGWVMESQQSALHLGPLLGISPSAICTHRQKARQRHIFGGTTS